MKQEEAGRGPRRSSEGVQPHGRRLREGDPKKFPRGWNG